jgi:squalene-hopene/tetraprenyl-beta-curcumene cyclase
MPKAWIDTAERVPQPIEFARTRRVKIFLLLHVPTRRYTILVAVPSNTTTKDLILNTTLTLLETEGATSLTLDRIASDAGLSKGGLLYHFASKEQLVEAMVQRAVASLHRPPAERARDLFAALLAAYTVEPAQLQPLRAAYRDLRNGVASSSSDPALATSAWLATECLALFEYLGLVNLTGRERENLSRKITALSQEIRMPETIALVQPALPAPVLPITAHQHEQQLRIRNARDIAARSLLSVQDEAGFWRGNLTADTTLESDYVLLNLWLDPVTDEGWHPAAKSKIDKAMATVIDRQLPDGGWNIYPGGPAELNATVRAYSALKICGHDPVGPVLKKARERVLSLGGLQAANSYTKINLSLFGLFPREFAPSVPPELLLIPGNLIYEMSSWTRAIIVPLSIIQASGVQRPAPNGVTLEELFIPGNKLVLPRKDRLSAIFNQADRVLKLWERRGMRDIRAKAVREAEKWMLERTRGADGLGAIYPSMMYSIMAMDVLGYERDHPDFVEALRHFNDLQLETAGRLEYQPCVSPVWDTAIALFALGESQTLPADAGRRAADWFLDREVRRKGDWAVKRPDLQPGGWAFEFANESYPDIDDTAMVLLALEHCTASDAQRQGRVERRAINWLLGMQSSDGGWAAFDADNNWHVLNKVPFADHNAMLDPTCPDITGRVMEALCRRGMNYNDPPIARGVAYLLTHHKTDGSWYGRWGVNYIYGTFLAVRGLRVSGSPNVRAALEKAAGFLRSVQNSDGGWGESCLSYDTHQFEAAPSTPSQTAWALLGLKAAGDTSSSSVTAGQAWLIEEQASSGSWPETLATGTGFPNVFYLNYHLYAHYFPLLAMATE